VHRRLLVVLAIVLLVVACQREPEEIRIGLLVATSGPQAAFGLDVERGARLAVEDLNADGGLLGRRVELVVRDSSDPAAITRQIGDLVDRERVSAVVGPETSGVVLSDRSPLARRDVPAVLPTAFAGRLGDAPTVVTRIVPSAHAQAIATARWLTDVRSITEVAVLVADPVEGEAAREEIIAGLEAGGVTSVAVVATGGDSPDLGPAVSRLRREAGDVGGLVVWAPPAQAARVTRAVRAQNWDVQIVVPATAFTGEYRSLAEDASEGVVLAFPFREEWFGPPLDDWLVRWHRRHGLDALAGLETLVLDLPVAGLAAYDAIGLIGAAVEEAGSAEPAAVGAALETIRHEGLLRGYRPERGESWEAEDLYLARFHNFAVIFDADPRLDDAWQRRFYDAQVQLDFIPESILEGPGGELIADLLEQRRATAPPYEPPAPPPGPVARPRDR
jgi:branched-chain amino acid transport system substrate-binding protein